MASGIQINLKGFEKMLEQLKEAERGVDKATAAAIEESAKIVETELLSAAADRNVPSDITSKIRIHTSNEGDRYKAEVGWDMGNYDPKNPSAGYKAIFLNYGTVRRRTAKGYNRGEIPKKASDQQFIHAAKKAARPKVRKAQQEIIKKALGDLEK